MRGLSIFGRGLIAASLGAAALLAAPSTASAKTYPAIGGAGDYRYPVQCNGGRYLIGLAGKVGGWIDSMSLECGKTGSDGMPGPLEINSTSGGAGGSPSEDRCAPGQLVTGVGVQLTGDNRMVKAIRYVCNPAGQKQRVRVGSPNSYSEEGKRRHELGSAVEGAGYGQYDTQECPDNEFAVGFNLRFGKHINGAGLICAPLPPPPPQVLTPITVGPAPKSTAPARPLGPPLLSEYLIAGVWHTTTGQGSSFDIMLNAPQDPGPMVSRMISTIPVNGTFVNTDGAHQYDGVINGYIQANTRMFIYTYVYTASGEHGAGQFYLAPDVMSIVGQGVHVAGETKTPFTWKGTRAR